MPSSEHRFARPIERSVQSITEVSRGAYTAAQLLESFKGQEIKFGYNDVRRPPRKAVAFEERSFCLSHFCFYAYGSMQLYTVGEHRQVIMLVRNSREPLAFLRSKNATVFWVAIVPRIGNHTHS